MYGKYSDEEFDRFWDALPEIPFKTGELNKIVSFVLSGGETFEDLYTDLGGEGGGA